MQLFLYGVGITMLYIIVAVGVMLIARKYLTIPDELFRKILHFILLGAYIALVFAFETWWMAAIFAISLIIDTVPLIGRNYKSISGSLILRKLNERPVISDDNSVVAIRNHRTSARIDCFVCTFNAEPPWNIGSEILSVLFRKIIWQCLVFILFCESCLDV